MIAYLVLFSLPAWLALVQSHCQTEPARTSNFRWLVFTWVFSLFIGLRHEVGGDWFHYLTSIQYFAALDLVTGLKNLQTSDPAFALLSWLSTGLGDIYFVNLCCGVLFTIGLISFCRIQPAPWLALTVAVPYLVTVVAMG